MNFSVNDTIPEKCSIFRMQLLELGLGGGDLEGFSCLSSWLFFAPGGCVCVCVCVCVCMIFHRTHLFSDACVDSFSEFPREKEKVQNAVIPDGKYYALGLMHLF